MAPSGVAVDMRSGRVVVVNDGDSTVSMLDARTAATLRTVPVSGSRHASYRNALAITLDESHGRAFVIHERAANLAGSPNGHVTVLDTWSGQVRRSLTVGRVPVALALHEATGHLFVINSAAGCLLQDNGWRMAPTTIRHWLPFLPQAPPPVCTSRGSVTMIDTAHV